jgi:hypothetical protein
VVFIEYLDEHQGTRKKVLGATHLPVELPCPHGQKRVPCQLPSIQASTRHFCQTGNTSKPTTTQRTCRDFTACRKLRYGPYLDGARDGHPGSAQRYANRRTEDALF